MIDSDLKLLGSRVAELRIGRQLKQTELAYEAGMSHRTLQRLEAGEVVKTDALLKVLKSLGRLDRAMAALEPSEFSPYEMLAGTGLKVSELDQQNTAAGRGRNGTRGASRATAAGKKRRVRRAAGEKPLPGQSAHKTGKAVKVQWPEDQK